MNLNGKKVLVVGVARSGIAAAKFAVSRGAIVTANDSKPESEFAADAAELRALGIDVQAGGHPEGLFTSQDLIILSPGVPPELPALKAAIAAGVHVVGEVDFASQFLKGRIIGITGSNGKTTTTMLADALMRATGARTLLGGNIGFPVTGLIDESSDQTCAVLELSSF